jgi:hypothetical protein
LLELELWTFNSLTLLTLQILTFFLKLLKWSNKSSNIRWSNNLPTAIINCLGDRMLENNSGSI